MLLSNALRGNAGFTAVCAIICLSTAKWVAVRSGLPNPAWAIGLGGMLASYVPILLIAAARPKIWLVTGRYFERSSLNALLSQAREAATVPVEP